MLPDGWEKQAIGNLCQSIVPGRNKPKLFDGHIPWVTTPEIQGRYIPSKAQQNYVSNVAIKESGAKLVPAGSVIIAAVGDLGLTAIAKEQVVLNQQLHAFVCPDFIDNEYLAYWLETQKQYMESIASKTTIPYMNKSNCESIPVAYPFLPEQQKIAKILSTWDKAIEKLEALITAKKKRKKSLMQQLLTGKNRFSGFEGEWGEMVQLESCVSLMKSGLSRKLSSEDIGLPVIRSGNIGDKYTEYNDVRYWHTDDPQGANTKNYILEDGDLLVNFINSASQIGKTCIYRNDLHRNCIYTTNILRVKPSPKIDSVYLYAITKTSKYEAYIQSITKPAVNQASFTTKEFKQFKFLLPPLPEQQKIAAILTVADKEIENHQNQLSALKQQKKGLMQQLLTGKKRVKLEEAA